MMKYRYTYYVLLCLALVGLVSCEMKDELLGKGEQGKMPHVAGIILLYPRRSCTYSLPVLMRIAPEQ